MPSFLSATRTPLAPAGGAVPVPNQLYLAWETQKQSNWCWAAVSFSTWRFYGTPVGKWTQCRIVQAEPGQSNCCANGSSASCDRPWYLDLALKRTGNLRAVRNGTVTRATIRSHVRAGRPIGVRIGWNGGGGHFVVVDGYNAAQGGSVTVKDPYYGTSTYPFATNYRGSGRWTHTCTTRP